jgi:hypothetical protein
VAADSIRQASSKSKISSGTANPANPSNLQKRFVWFAQFAVPLSFPGNRDKLRD